jgi:scyllo-inositol 2-dehydrogenase (NADP+)
MIDVGLIGFGLGGKAFHAPVIAAVEGLRLAAVLQRHENTAAEIYPGVKIVRTIEEMLSIESIKLVAISTPNDSHYSCVKACPGSGARRGGGQTVHDDAYGSERISGAGAQAGAAADSLSGAAADGDFATLKKLIANGELGRPVHYEETFDRCRAQVRDSWKEKVGPGCGVFWDLAPHLIDHALVLFGEPEALLADLRLERDGARNVDAFDVTFYYASGFRAVMSSSTLAPVARPHFRVRGTRGEFIKQGLDPQEALLRAGQPMGGPSWGLEKPEEWGTLSVVEGEQKILPRKVESARGDYRAFYENVRDVMLRKTKPLVTLDEALRVMYALELSEVSSGQRAVLPWRM